MEPQKPIAILGGGIAGLSAGSAARDLGLPFLIFEKAEQAGGNCRTFRHDGFRFDSGAHRVHDRDAETTARLSELLGDRLRQIHAPSQVYHREKLLAFPFKMKDLAAKLGWPFLLRAAGEVLAARLRRGGAGEDFASTEERNYGRTLARLFLLNYSEKLWGLPGKQLAVEISGKRLAGLSLKSFLKETFLPSSRSVQHLEGSFYYPDGGIGAVSEALAGACGPEAIRTHAEVSRVWHDGRRIQAVEIHRNEVVACSAVVSTIPLDRLLQRLDPQPPADALRAAAGLRFRQLALVAFFLDRETVTRAATIYFPDRRFPFTRVYEPKNRSLRMAPFGRTSLVAEIPYAHGDAIGSMADKKLIALARSHLTRVGLFAEKDVLAAGVHRLADAYPVLTREAEGQRREIFAYLNGLANLKTAGRSGTFRYLHIHDLLPEAARAVAELRLQEN